MPNFAFITVGWFVIYSSRFCKKVLWVCGFSLFWFLSFILKHLLDKRYRNKGSLRPSCNKCGFDPTDVIRQSRDTLSSSSTGPNSSNSDKPPRYERSRRNKSGKKGFINDNQAYSSERGHNMVHRIKDPSSTKKAVCRQQKWFRRFEATNSVGCLSKEHHSLLTESRRMPPEKRKNLLSSDSGFLEDDKTTAVRRAARKSLPVPDTRENHHNRLSHSTSYKHYHSQFDDGYLLRNLPQHRPDRAPSDVFHEDNSSDSEVFQKRLNRSGYEGSSCDDLGFQSHPRRTRKKTNRSKLPKYSIQKDVPYSRHPSVSHGLKLAYQAIASYRDSTDDTIDLYEGDKVQVIRKSKGGWWLVKTDHDEGWAPSNYLEPITCYDEWICSAVCKLLQR